MYQQIPLHLDLVAYTSDKWHSKFHARYKYGTCKTMSNRVCLLLDIQKRTNIQSSMNFYYYFALLMRCNKFF